MQRRGEQVAFSVGVQTEEAFVTAMGVGSVAREMVRIARRCGVPILRNDGTAHRIQAQVNAFSTDQQPGLPRPGVSRKKW